jgi:hypothetical protein
VLLTPGPYNETYFEHALLARYLGFALVEGSDLTVRDGCVWMKTVEGLKRVHASCAGRTTTTATRWSCAPTRRWACPASPTARAAAR